MRYVICNYKQQKIYNQQSNQEQQKFKIHNKTKEIFSHISIEIKYINKSSKGCQQENKLEYLYSIHFGGRQIKVSLV